MSNQRTHGSSRGLRRLLCGVLSLVLLLGLLPASALPAQAASQSWAMPYMEQLVDWGVMRGDVGGNLAPSRSITRAEFVTLINRAYGYTRMAGTPFTDVRSSDWYAQDIDIAYNMGYFKGTSPTTASPLSPVTREQAAVLLTRNLMLQETTGETLGFSDSRTLAEWSRGLIGAAAANNIITGYSDGSFRPQSNITRGEVAAMLVRSIGTPINEAGDYDMGAVYGNVTINTSGVNLRNSTITGNLYLTGGVDLGDVLLENVNVLGQIIVSGAGESNSSQSSILLRNVEADEMIVDSISNQFVTIRAEGNTAIGTTSVRTNAYVDDSSLPGFGLSRIELDGDSGALLQLAGNPKEVVNKTPNSSLQFVQGVADKVTVDEKAVGSSVLVDTGTRVGELNLDVATNVTGDGDIKNLNVGAAGSTVAQLPEQIEIRPGITSSIAGTNMTSTIAAESSADPKLQAGYPKVKDVAPTSAVAVFSTNKAGTVYWALSPVADGSVSEDDLINPPVYGGKAVKSGNLKAAASKTEYTVNLSGLTSDGSYYLSAIMVDDRGSRSPLKVTAFTTPDSTTPAFASGYPVISKNTTDTIQTTVMANKDCVMYYALLPSGSTAPKAQDFKSASISGHLGYGSVDLVKNVTQPVNVNNVKLDELTKYDLYLWLTDHNGAKSSSVRKITVTTPDETPPVITYLEQNLSRTTGTAIGMTYTLNEPGRVYWVIYADDITNAFAAEFGRDRDDKDDEGNSKWRGTEVRAKAFVKAGLNGIKKGTSTASKAEAEINFAISGLNSKNTGTTSYMLYVVAEDRAGNLAETVEAVNVRTLDTDPPTVKQEFTEVDPATPTEPEPHTSIRLVFSESVQGDPAKSEKFLELYNAGKTDDLAKALDEHIKMHYVDAKGKDSIPAPRTDVNEAASTDWIVDWRKARVSMDNGDMIVELPYSSNSAQSALNLKSGATYYFVLNGIRDQALTPNVMNKGYPLKLPEFRIMFAHVSVNRSESYVINAASGLPAGHAAPPFDIDFNFTVEPDSVESVEDAMMWDMLIWTDRTMEYEIYSRPIQEAGTIDNGTGWVYEGSDSVLNGTTNDFVYKSFYRAIKGWPAKDTEGPGRAFPYLNKMKTEHGYREYAIKVIKAGASNNDGINVKISIVAGYYTGVNNVASSSRQEDLDKIKVSDGVATIGRPDPRTLYKEFRDSEPPKFKDNYPVITAGDISATVDVMIDKPGYVYWLAVPLNSAVGLNKSIPAKGQEGNITDYRADVEPTALGLGKNWTNNGAIVDPYTDLNGIVHGSKSGKPVYSEIPTGGDTADRVDNTDVNSAITDDKRYYLRAPDRETVVALAKEGTNGSRRGGVTERLRANITGNPITISNLKPDTCYLLYTVIANTSDDYEVNPEVYRFTTEKAVRPSIDANIYGQDVKIEVFNTPTASVDYILVLRGNEPAGFEKDFWAEENGYATEDLSASYPSVVSVLDAMEYRVVGANGYEGTLFDQFATQDAKDEFAARIRNSRPSNTIRMQMSNVTFTQADNTVTGKNMVNCTGMTGTNNYTFIAVGRSPMGSGDAFRATHSVRLDDTTPPKVDFARSGVQVKEWDGNRIKEGVVTLEFTEGLYSRPNEDKKPIPVDNCVVGAKYHANVDTQYQAVGGILSPGSGYITVQGDDSHSSGVKWAPVETIVLNVNDAQDGFKITFRNNYICDADGNGTGRGGLTVTIRIKQVGTGDNARYEASLEVPNDWKK